MLKDFPIRQSTAFSTGSSPVVALLFTAEAALVLLVTSQTRACNIWVIIKGPRISGACLDITDGTSYCASKHWEAEAMLSPAQCSYCGNPLVTQNVKADVIQCFHGPHKSPSMPPKPKVSRAFKKDNFGPENGCPGWEVPNRWGWNLLLQQH